MICDAPLVATLDPYPHHRAMHRITDADHGEWTEARLDRLARGMFPVVFGRPAPDRKTRQGVPVLGVLSPAHSLKYWRPHDD